MKILVIVLLFMPKLGFNQSWLWEVSKKGINHKSYLFGTFHDMGNWYLDSLKKVKNIIRTSEIVMVEKINGSASYETSLENSAEVKGRSITLDLLKHLGEGRKYWNGLLQDSSRKIFERFIEQYQMAGIYLNSPEDVFLTMQRYYAMDFCDNARRHTDSIFRMDHYIEIIARHYNIELIGLDDLTPENGNMSVKSRSIEKTNDTLWVQGSVWYMNLIMDNKRNAECEAINDYVNVTPPFYLNKKRIDYFFNVVERNNVWLDIILKHLPQRSCFIASGYQHMRFKDGLITMLRKNGYKVRPVKM